MLGQKKKCITKGYQIEIVNRNSKIAKNEELQIAHEKTFY